MGHIYYNLDNMKTYPDQFKGLSTDDGFSKETTQHLVTDNSKGKVADEVSNCVEKTDILSSRCQMLCSATAIFMTRAVTCMEERDRELARKIER